MGLRPIPHSGTFLGKSPRDPKKPDCIGFRLSNVDSEQGCRTAALLFVHAGRAAPQPPADPRLGIRRTCIARAPSAYRASVPHAPAPPHALAEHRPHIRTTRPPRHAYPSLTLLRSLIYPPFLSPSPCTAAHPPQGSPASTTPLACRASRAHSRAVRRRALAVPHAPRRLMCSFFKPPAPDPAVSSARF